MAERKTISADPTFVANFARDEYSRLDEGLPELPLGLAYVVDSDGAYLTDTDGAYITTEMESYDSSAWTGVESAVQKLHAVRSLIPLAQSAIEVMIEDLENSHNGGPPLDEVQTALTHLRMMHSKLGEILLAAEEGYLSSYRGEGLMQDATRFALRLARDVAEDPLRYAFSAMLLGLFTACGFPGAGGFVSSATFSIKKASLKG